MKCILCTYINVYFHTSNKSSTLSLSLILSAYALTPNTYILKKFQKFVMCDDVWKRFYFNQRWVEGGSNRQIRFWWILILIWDFGHGPRPFCEIRNSSLHSVTLSISYIICILVSVTISHYLRASQIITFSYLNIHPIMSPPPPPQYITCSLP